MAKITGPLMSVAASGAFAGAMVFATWKGRPYARQLVTPANPRSAGQEAARNAARCAAAGQKWANQTTLKQDGETLTDKQLLQAAAPAGMSWNGYLVQSMIGVSAMHHAAAEAEWAALTAPQKAAWDAFGAGTTPPFPNVHQTVEGGGDGTPHTPGQAAYHYVYGLGVAGVAAYPTATPPTYA